LCFAAAAKRFTGAVLAETVKGMGIGFRLPSNSDPIQTPLPQQVQSQQQGYQPFHSDYPIEPSFQIGGAALLVAI